eukprot:3587912-Pyramimonas_sp.AAC.1
MLNFGALLEHPGHIALLASLSALARQRLGAMGIKSTALSEGRRGHSGVVWLVCAVQVVAGTAGLRCWISGRLDRILESRLLARVS